MHKKLAAAPIESDLKVRDVMDEKSVAKLEANLTIATKSH